MATSQFVSTPLEGINFSLTYTPYDQTAAITTTNSPDNPGPPFTAGTVAKGSGDSEWVFIKASAAIAAGDVCLIAADFQAAGVTTTTATGSYQKQVGVAVVAIASGAYGWLQRCGIATPTGVRVADGCTPYTRLTTTATAGVLDDATTTALVYIDGVVVNSTNAAGSTVAKVATLNYPTVSTVIP
jgi:hypothetical protein